MAEYLLFGTERYALPILQPLADALQEAGHGVHAWFVDGAKDAALRGGVRPVAHARAAVALRPGSSASAHRTTCVRRSIRMVQSAFRTLAVPPIQVVTTHSGNSLAAASAVFSPSTTSTGRPGYLCSLPRL